MYIYDAICIYAPQVAMIYYHRFILVQNDSSILYDNSNNDNIHIRITYIHVQSKCAERAYVISWQQRQGQFMTNS